MISKLLGITYYVIISVFFLGLTESYADLLITF